MEYNYAYFFKKDFEFDTSLGLNRYALTISVCPNERIGRKLWKNFTHVQQEQYLKNIYSIGIDHEVYYHVESEIETGPTNGCRHMHCLIETDRTVKEIVQFFPKTFVKDYNTYDCRLITNYQGWLDYISKDKIKI